MNLLRFTLGFALAASTAGAAHALTAPVSASIAPQEIPAMPPGKSANEVPAPRQAYVPVVEKSTQAPVVAKAEGPSAPNVATVPVKVLYVQENQPVQIVDSQGRLLQVIYLKKSK